MLDLVLAILHHILAFGLVAMLIAEGVLVKPDMTAAPARRVAGLDRGYGAISGHAVIAPTAR